MYQLDRKSTRLNSSHLVISYAVFCLKKKKQKTHAKTAEGVSVRSTRDMLAVRDSVRSLPTARVVLHRLFFCFFRFCFFIFFFKERGPPGFLPFSPPRPFPN